MTVYCLECFGIVPASFGCFCDGSVVDRRRVISWIQSITLGSRVSTKNAALVTPNRNSTS
jgi:Tfp pilus assembly PilM family ATPase